MSSFSLTTTSSRYAIHLVQLYPAVFHSEHRFIHYIDDRYPLFLMCKSMLNEYHTCLTHYLYLVLLLYKSTGWIYRDYNTDFN